MAWRFADAFGMRQRIVSANRILERELISAPGRRGRRQDASRMLAEVST
jgi:hypothetical protein